MLDLTDVGTYEAITCYSDSICYIDRMNKVSIKFSMGFYNSLRDDRVFMFDVHSAYQIDEVFLITATTIKQMSLPFSGKVTKEKFLTALNIFDFFVQNEDGTFQRMDELHRERTYSLESYQRMLENAGFSEIRNVCRLY